MGERAIWLCGGCRRRFASSMSSSSSSSSPNCYITCIHNLTVCTQKSLATLPLPGRNFFFFFMIFHNYFLLFYLLFVLAFNLIFYCCIVMIVWIYVTVMCVRCVTVWECVVDRALLISLLPFGWVSPCCCGCWLFLSNRFACFTALDVIQTCNCCVIAMTNRRHSYATASISHARCISIEC